MLRRLVAAAVILGIMLMLFSCTKKEDVNQENVPGVVDNPWLDDTAAVNEEIMPDARDTNSQKPVSEDDTVPSSDSSEDATATDKPGNNTDDTAVTETTVPAETTAPAIEIVPTTEYEWYHALSGEEQEAYMESFESTAAFFKWYNAAKAEYEAQHPSIEIGDGVIDFGDLLGGNG